MKGKKISNVRKPNEPIADAVRERFAQQLAGGLSQTAALRAVNPNAKNWSNKTTKQKASRLAAEPDIQKRKQEILEAMIPSTVMKKCELLEMISDELREAHKEPGMLSAASALVDKFAKLMDWYPKQELTVKNGGVSDDYKAPPSIMAMDAKTLAKLAEGTL